MCVCLSVCLPVVRLLSQEGRVLGGRRGDKGGPWDQLSELDRELVIFIDSRATAIRNAAAWTAWHFTQPQLPLY